MDEAIKWFSVLLFSIFLLLLVIVFLDVSSVDDVKTILGFKLVDPRLLVVGKETYGLYPYCLFFLLTSIVFAINSSWVTWNNFPIRLIASSFLFVLAILIALIPSFNASPPI